jgi:hypothetical protein
MPPKSVSAGKAQPLFSIRDGYPPPPPPLEIVAVAMKLYRVKNSQALEVNTWDLFDLTIKQHDGQIVKYYSDGIKAEFIDATGALKCAIILQKKKDIFDFCLLIEYRYSTDEPELTYGDVVIVDAKIKSLFKPGDIFVSQDIVSAVRGDEARQLKLSFDEVGLRKWDQGEFYRVKPLVEGVKGRVKQKSTISNFDKKRKYSPRELSPNDMDALWRRYFYGAAGGTFQRDFEQAFYWHYLTFEKMRSVDAKSLTDAQFSECPEDQIEKGKLRLATFMKEERRLVDWKYDDLPQISNFDLQDKSDLKSLKNEKRGVIYILTNPTHPHFLKVGRTTRDPYIRAAEMSSETGVVMPFTVSYFRNVSDCFEAEKRVHEVLAKYRNTNNREFFKLDIMMCQRIIEQTIPDLFVDSVGDNVK